MDEKTKDERRKEVVDFLLDKSQKEDKKPEPNTADVDQKEVEDILNKIRKKIQEKK